MRNHKILAQKEKIRGVGENEMRKTAEERTYNQHQIKQICKSSFM